MKQKKISALAVRGILAAVLIIAGILCVYPFLYVFSMSISAPEHVIRKDVTFLPKGFSLEGYKLVFENPTVWRSYRNTILYTVFGTALNMVLTVLAAYPLSREKFVLRRPVSILITITMYVSGGMIPFFIVCFPPIRLLVGFRQHDLSARCKNQAYSLISISTPAGSSRP